MKKIMYAITLCAVLGLVFQTYVNHKEVLELKNELLQQSAYKDFERIGETRDGDVTYLNSNILNDNSTYDVDDFKESIVSISANEYYEHDFSEIEYSGKIFLVLYYKCNKDTTINISYDIDNKEKMGSVDVKDTNDNFVYKLVELFPNKSVRIKSVGNNSKKNGLDFEYTLLAVTEKSFKKIMDNHTITPELFGCVGDGVVDDRNEMQDAINICNEYGYTLTSKQNKTYLINGSLIVNLDKLNIDFGNATIKSKDSDLNGDFILKIDNKNSGNISHHNSIKNIVVDCNNTGGGIEITYGFKIVISDITINNCSGTAYQMDDGAEVFLQNTHIQCDGSAKSVGIEIQTSDCHFNDIVIVDAQKAIINSGTNFYSRVHGWNISTWDDTIFFEHLGGNVVMNECQIDTYQTGISYRCSYKLSLIGCTYFLNEKTRIYSSAKNKKNTVIQLSDSASWYSRKISLIGCNIRGDTNTELSNIVNQIQLIDYQSTGHIKGIEKTICSSQLSDSLENVVINQLFNKNGNTYLKIVADIKQIDTSDNFLVGDLQYEIFYPKYGYEPTFIANFVNMKTGEITPKEGWITEGKIYIDTSNVDIDGTKMYIDISYTEREIE